MKPSFSDMNVRRSFKSIWSFALALGLFLAVTMPASAAVTDAVDVSQPFYFPFAFQHTDVMAQTFIAGKTAAMDRVSLASDAMSFANITIEIHSVVPGTPSTPGDKLPGSGSASFKGNLPCCRQFNDFYFDQPVQVTAGTHYAIVVNVNAGDFTWYSSGPYDVYAGGQLFYGCAGCGLLSGGGGDFAFKTWVITGAAVPPSLVISGAPNSSPEGTTISVTGSVSGPAAPTSALAAAPSYTWSVTKDTVQFISGSGSTFSFTPDDEGTYVVTLGVTGSTTKKQATITVLNVPPTVKITGVTASAPLVLTTQETVTFNASFTDPGAPDRRSATWTFDDGAPVTTDLGVGGSAAVTTTRSFSTAGTHTVKLTVTDEDGGVGEATVQVSVQTVAQALSSIITAVQNLTGLNQGQKNSLIAKLNAASDSAARGDTTAANNQLNAFLNELQADVNTGRISSADATTLRAAVNAIKAAMGTYNRFLSWWPLSA